MAKRPSTSSTKPAAGTVARSAKSPVASLVGWAPKAVRRLARRVRAGAGTLTLKPRANVKQLGRNRFRALNGDPQMELVPKHGFPVGWVRFDLHVAKKPEYAFAPQLFYNAGRGIREVDSFQLPAPKDGRLTAFFRLPAGVRQLRFDVGEDRGEFSVISVRLREISGPEAWMEHLSRLSLGRASWHPAPPWEQSELLLKFKDRARTWLGDEGTAQRLSVRLVERPARDARLALYASEDNEKRVRDVQRAPIFADLPARELDAGVSVVILNLNKPELIVPLLDRLDRERQAFTQRGLRLQVLVGDTGSTDAAVLARYDAGGPDTVVRRGLKYHFSRCNNNVARFAECSTLLFLNNDVIFPDDRTPVLDMFTTLHAQSTRGIAGCCLYYEDGRVQHIGVDFSRHPSIRGLCYHPKVRSRIDPEGLRDSWVVPAVTGACLMIRHELFMQTGMDEDYAAECQDIALCLDVDRLGYEIHIVNAGRCLHLENATRPKGEEHWPDRQHFLRRWGSYIEARYL